MPEALKLLLAACVLAASSPALCQSDAKAGPVQVTVTGDPTNRIGQTAYVVVAVRNTGATDILLKNMNVSLDGAATDRFTGSTSCRQQRIGEIRLPPATTVEQTCRFEMKHATLFGAGALTQSSLLAADVRLAVQTDVHTIGVVEHYPVFRIPASESSIFVGGFAGALMLALFVLIEKVLKSPDARQAWVKTIFITLAMAFRGGLMAVIALLISKTTQSTGSPVSLTVSDFAGGVLIGLFSYPLASWLSSTLKLDANAFPPSQGGPDKPNPFWMLVGRRTRRS